MHVLKKFVLGLGVSIFLLLFGCATTQPQTQPQAQPQPQTSEIGQSPPTPTDPATKSQNSDMVTALSKHFDASDTNCKGEMTQPKEVLLYIADLMSHTTARRQISCKQQLIQSADGKNGVIVTFEKGSYKVSSQLVNVADGLKGESEQIDLDDQDSGNVNISIVMRVAYALAKNNPKPGIDSGNAEFEAFLSSFPVSNAALLSEILPVKGGDIKDTDTRSYKTLATTSVYWGDSKTTAGDTTVIVETEPGKYAMTVITR